MKYVGHINIGNNQAGSGDSYCPKSKLLNEKLFFTPKQVKEFKDKYKKIHCYLCKKRIYISKTYFLGNNQLVVCEKCKEKVYLK